ncbi:uncharacterized protein E5676_scaffold344G00120 [Cucumis melo var. makuwa]|uniref:Uncharacterized protein n=2 Tax=Cucumis melo TaxID=3656 RepID=A0A5D3E3Y1_CUCMM|nr:uncharacterized protein LOC103495109 isoform X2 [Cucumis melo]TYK30260.1 uncharacterized protein E5676_scaffold344G00120 [Cucumis melo var. makuwa]
MALLCFLLDLRTFPPPILTALTDLANLYAISSSSSASRIGLCYVKNASFVPHDVLLEVAYSPIRCFSLCQFHRAVRNLPTDAFIPEIDGYETLRCLDVKLSAVLSDQVLYSWECEDVKRKVIVLSASSHYDLDSNLERTLEEAASMRVLVEFVIFEQKSSHLNVIEEDPNGLMKRISDFDGCSLKLYLPDVRIFQSLVRRWLQDLKDDMKEPLLACFDFKENLIYSTNQITCNLYTTVTQMIDGFSTCQTCRCHGMPLEVYRSEGIKESSCAISGDFLDTSGIMKNSMKVGEKTILFLPSAQCLDKSQQNASQIKFDVVQRTNLGTLCESIIMGAAYVVVPSSLRELESASADNDPFAVNALAFQGLCGALHSLDQGLICLSKWNMETLNESTFPCYYILQPSQNGSMFLRRLAASEEVHYVPDIKSLITTHVSKEIQSSILVSLEKVELKDYNPLMHERGLHQKLNVLVKESLEFRPSTPTAEEGTSGKETNVHDSLKGTLNHVKDIEIVTTPMDGTESGVAETWEKLVTHEFPETCPVYVSKDKLDGFSLSLSYGNRPLAAKTSRILERLEAPRQRSKATSPNTLTIGLIDPNAPTKKPPIPLVPVLTRDQGFTGTQSQLMKPNFNKHKRKRT